MRFDSSGFCYVTGIVTFVLAFSGCPTCHAFVVVRDMFNRTLMHFEDAPATFGPEVPARGLWGHIVYAEPNDACTAISPPPQTKNHTTWIALIIRYPCLFDQKVLNAQLAGYQAVIIYNNGSDDLVPMHSDSGYSIRIPSVFVAESSGMLLQQFDKRLNVTIELWQSGESLTFVYFVVLGCIAGLGIMLGFCIVFTNWICQRARKRMTLLSKRKLKKLPVHKFKTGDRFDTCAICLEEYVDGDKLRVLPCGHAYHCKCIDPWLTEKMNTCPLCKDVVGRRSRREVATPDERQPLLVQVETEPEEELHIGATANSATEHEALAEVHASPSFYRTYGSVDESALPPAVALSVVINENTFGDRAISATQFRDIKGSDVADEMALTDDQFGRHGTVMENGGADSVDEEDVGYGETKVLGSTMDGSSSMDKCVA